jgi:hypothetical protein
VAPGRVCGQLVPVAAGLVLVGDGAKRPAVLDIEEVLQLQMAGHRAGQIIEDTGGDHRAVL